MQKDTQEFYDLLLATPRELRPAMAVFLEREGRMLRDIESRTSENVLYPHKIPFTVLQARLKFVCDLHALMENYVKTIMKQMVELPD